jgi:hypothetical protein
MAESTVLNLCSVEITKDEYFREQRQLKKKKSSAQKKAYLKKNFLKEQEMGFALKLNLGFFTVTTVMNRLLSMKMYSMKCIEHMFALMR